MNRRNFRAFPLAAIGAALLLAAGCQTAAPPAQSNPSRATPPPPSAPPPPPSQSVAQLRQSMKDPNEYVRMAAVDELGRRAALSPEAFDGVVEALGDPEHSVRKEAVVALEKMGRKAAPATKAIARLLHGKEIYLRVFAADALAAIGPGARAALPDLKIIAARGYADIQDSPEFEARQLPDAVDKAIRSIEGKKP